MCIINTNVDTVISSVKYVFIYKYAQIAMIFLLYTLIGLKSIMLLVLCNEVDICLNCLGNNIYLKL